MRKISYCFILLFFYLKKIFKGIILNFFKLNLSSSIWLMSKFKQCNDYLGGKIDFIAVLLLIAVAVKEQMFDS